LVAEIAGELAQAEAKSRRTGSRIGALRVSCGSRARVGSRRRRVVAKSEWTTGEANPRFVVTYKVVRADAVARHWRSYLMNQNTFGLLLTMSDAMDRPLMIAVPTEGAVFLLNGSPIRIATDARRGAGRDAGRMGQLAADLHRR
jgi:hypothetical protein